MKKTDFIFTVLLVPLDLLAIFLAFLLAYYIRFNLALPGYTYLWPFSDYLKFFPYFLPVWVFIFALEGLYNIRRAKRGLRELSSVFLGVSAGVAILVMVVFLTRFFIFSRLVVIYAWLLAFIFVALGRFALRSIQKALYRYKVGVHNVLLIGKNEISKNIAEEIKTNPSFGLRLLKSIDRNGIDKLDVILSKNNIDEIILTDPALPEKDVEKILQFCEENKLVFKMVPNLFRAKSTNVEIETISSYPLVEFKKTTLEGWGRVAKRIFDIVGALIGLVLTLPIFLIVPILIKLDSRGPVFFKQKRVGGGGKEFELLKFRSMIKEAPRLYEKLVQEQKKKLFLAKIKDDPRITKFGRFLRTTCIDEIPQFINVLKGEMSLVGPRPLTPEEFKQVSNYEKKYIRTSYIKPGLTGLWQIQSRFYLSDEERCTLDIYYVENWSLMLDIWILIKTPLAILRNRKEIY